jgi:hypothetical protein
MSTITTPCQDIHELRQWIATHLDLVLPERAVCPNHCSPSEYLRLAYFEPAQDLVVWAPRGGGKTRLAAVATLLDLLHKPGIAVRIVGGSLQQALLMWEHLLPDLETLAEGMFDGKSRAQRIRLSNQSTVAVAAQSQRAVRGLRVQKLRCDEVELFKPDIWSAAQLTTRSRKDREGRSVRGVIEALSTYHQPHGLMGEVIARAEQRKTPLLRWCLLDVLEKCPPERECASCPLFFECQGVAKTACSGFFSIDDAIAMKRRVSLEMWESEMMCLRPSRGLGVFPHFRREVHVCESPAFVGSEATTLTLAVDFGFRNPFACLWIRATRCGIDESPKVFVFDEYIESGLTLEQHLAAIQDRHGRAAMVCCDPAGNARNDQTAVSNVQILRRHGYYVVSRQSAILDGIERIRAALRPAVGDPRLFIHPRCRRLIEAMEGYRFPPGQSELPLKDGTHDHPVDALRYFFVNATRQQPAGERETY